MSFKFVSEICNTFEMPRSSYNRPDRKINTSLLFCQFASDILDVVYYRFEEFKITRKNLSIISFLLASRTLVDKSTFLIAEGVFEPKRPLRPLDHMLVSSNSFTDVTYYLVYYKWQSFKSAFQKPNLLYFTFSTSFYVTEISRELLLWHFNLLASYGMIVSHCSFFKL